MEINVLGVRRWAGRGEGRRWMAVGMLTSHLCSLDTLEDFVVTHTEMAQKERFLSAEQYCAFYL